MVVSKNALMMRDTEGKLIPVEIESKIFGGTIKIMPLTKGDFNMLAGKKDSEIIYKYLLEPVLSEEELQKNIPMKAERELVTLILEASGMTREEIGMAMEQGIKSMNNRLKKN